MFHKFSPYNSLPVLMYHEVTGKEHLAELSKKIQFSYVLDIIKFEQQMRYLRKKNFSTLGITDMLKIVNILHNDIEEKKERKIVLTFDDGFIGNYKNVFPILIENGFIGTFFLITSRIDKEGMMNWDQIREMTKCGMKFGSHTAEHVLLGSLNQNDIFYQLDFSRKKIEDETGQKVEYLSLPHGSYNKRYKSIAAKIGYSGGFTSDPGLNGPTTDPFYLKRMNVPRNASLSYFIALCEKQKHIYRKVFAKKKAIAIFKKILGESFYLSMYNKLFGVDESNSEQKRPGIKKYSTYM